MRDGGDEVIREIRTVTTTAAEPQARRWHFASFMLDELTLELMLDGVEIEIERKPLEVLMHLLQHAGEVVTKDELLAAVWPGRILSDTVLTKCIGRVREVLRDQDQALIKTVYGYGYRLVAPVRVETQRAPERAHFDFNAGDRPPGRPLWSLVHRLGGGGHGEAWLGQHDKTREQRVFKFAIDEVSLTALKREITLFRFLNDSLGEHARIVPLMDWNLEQPPCFIESQYIAGGSLIDWAERGGGLARVPLAVRLDVAAQIADALAAVHSVGVLHKDLKPSNILVDAGEGAKPIVRLADFGSGGVLDPKQLEALGITRLGFTKTVAALNTTSGTPLYLAPELLAGQPPTVKADIYAFGVLLYQLVTGEFRKAMSAGWERDVDDELLREYIAAAAQGEPERRSADAADIAARLRSLEQDREARRIERETRANVEAANRALEKLRARRAGLIAAAAVLVIGAVTSTVLYFDARKARDEAAAAAQASQAVADFLSKDMFAAVGTKPLRDLTVPELLKSASETLTARVDVRPEAAAQINASLGSAFWTMEMLPEAEKHLDQALDYYERLGSQHIEAASAVATTLVGVKFMLGKLPTMLPRYQETLRKAQSELESAHPAVLGLRNNLAHARFEMGDWRGAQDEFQKLLDDAARATPIDNGLIAALEHRLAFSLLRLGEFQAAAARAQKSQERMTAIKGMPQIPVAESRMLRATALMELEQFSESESELSQALLLLGAWTASENSGRAALEQFGYGRLRLRQGRHDEAVAALEGAVRGLVGSTLSQSVDQTAEWRLWLALAYRDAGRLDAAAAEMRRALASSERAFGSLHPLTQSARIGLADILRLRAQPGEAEAVLAAVNRDALLKLGPDHPYIADLHRVEGLLALAGQRQPEAQQALAEALRIFELRYGPQHAFTQRARAELARASQRTAAFAAERRRLA